MENKSPTAIKKNLTPLIKSAIYFNSFVDVEKCPEDNKNVFAFIGRSNVGKSSLINALCNQKNLAKTSATPGKTKMLNYFLINQAFYFVDMPGFGFAKISHTEKENWNKNLNSFLKKMKIKQLFVLIDASISSQKIDLDFINSLGEKKIPFVIIFTKADRENQAVIQKNIQNLEKQLFKTWLNMPKYFLTSCKKKHGINPVVEFIFNASF